MTDLDEQGSYSRLQPEFQGAVRHFAQKITASAEQGQEALDRLKSDITAVVETQLNETLSATGGTLEEDFNTLRDSTSKAEYEKIVTGCAKSLGINVDPNDDQQALDVLKRAIVDTVPKERRQAAFGP